MATPGIMATAVTERIISRTGIAARIIRATAIMDTRTADPAVSSIDD
jgi:hypothetical protein